VAIKIKIILFLPDGKMKNKLTESLVKSQNTMKTSKPNFHYEKEYATKFSLTYSQAIGVDEVGRGCLAGDVVACACILSQNIPATILNKIQDSKKLSAQKRQLLSNELQNFCEYSYGIASVEEIDSINILQASLLAMQRAVNTLLQKLALGEYFILVDGNKLPKFDLPVVAIVKGDEKSYSIASASILAKVHRDNLMQELSKQYPHYDWQNNAGYGVKKHLDAIDKYGITPHHRLSFAPIKRRILH